jgi:hypothetical protein
MLFRVRGTGGMLTSSFTKARRKELRGVRFGVNGDQEVDFPWPNPRSGNCVFKKMLHLIICDGNPERWKTTFFVFRQLGH